MDEGIFPRTGKGLFSAFCRLTKSEQDHFLRLLNVEKLFEDLRKEISDHRFRYEMEHEKRREDRKEAKRIFKKKNRLIERLRTKIKQLQVKRTRTPYKKKEVEVVLSLVKKYGRVWTLIAATMNAHGFNVTKDSVRMTYDRNSK